MANIIFYSTGEIFWVSDPPYWVSDSDPEKAAQVRKHIVVPPLSPPVPPDHFFTYAMAAHALSESGHNVIGVFGRQRWEVRRRKAEKLGGPDPQFLALGDIEQAEKTVLVLIATDTDSRANGGSDHLPRIPFSEEEKASFQRFRERGGGVYVTWDHGQLGYQSMTELGLNLPVVAEPEEPMRPNVFHSHDSTSSARVEMDGWQRRKCPTPEEPNKICNDKTKVWLSVGPPAGYLQKIVPADVLRRPPAEPHPIFNGVGGADGLWIPAHSHEGKLNVEITLLGFTEHYPPGSGIKTLAAHVPLVETTFITFAVMAYKDAEWEIDTAGNKRITRGAIIWDTSFHHLCDINWSSNGKVPWDSFVPFSAEALWVRQFPQELFEERIDRGIKRLFRNAIKWLANELPDSPAKQVKSTIHLQPAGFKFMSSEIDEEFRSEADRLSQPEDSYPSEDILSTVSPG